MLCLAFGCDVGTPARIEAPADSAAGEVSFQLTGIGGAALVVPVYVNGQGPFDLLLDTGATLTCVDRTLAEELALPRQPGALGVGAGVGGTGIVRLVRVDSLRVGASQAHDMTACVIDLSGLGATGVGVRGLLGLNFLKSFRVTLDFEREILRLQAP